MDEKEYRRSSLHYILSIRMINAHHIARILVVWLK